MGYPLSGARPSTANASGGGQAEQPLTIFAVPVLADEAGNAIAASQKYGALAVSLVDAATGAPYTAGGSGASVAGSSSGGAQANNVTLAGASGKTTYIDGFVVTGLGATSATTIDIQVQNVVGGPLHFALAIPAGVTTAIVPLNVAFGAGGLAASTTNQSITVSVPSFGSGNTTASVSAWGHQQ